MRISRKIGLSFFVTFLLVILLGSVSIYSLRHIYKGLSQVFAKDLPASRFIYEIAISMERVLSESNSFLITGNENFRISYENSYKNMQDNILLLRKFISKEEEVDLFEKVKGLAGEIYGLSAVIFDKKSAAGKMFGDIAIAGAEYTKKLDKLFDYEEEKMRGEKDFLLIQAQHIPASRLIMEARSTFSGLIDELAGYVIRDKEAEPGIIIGNISALKDSIRDYKNYYGYSLSDAERNLTSELIELSEKIRTMAVSVVDLKKEIDVGTIALLTKEKSFMDALDNMIAIKKSDISSKLGVGAALTEDIPAIHNISKLEKDIAESWWAGGRYILTGDARYKSLYYALRQDIDKEMKDYGRHARLRGVEEFFNGVIDTDDNVSNSMDLDIKMLEEKKALFSDMFLRESKIRKKTESAIEYKDALIKEAKNQSEVMKSIVPARWILMRIKGGISNASRAVMNYLNGQEAKHKDAYSELYFNMKKHLNNYRNLSIDDKDLMFAKEIEQELDGFNTDVLGVIDRHDRLMKDMGWILVKLQDELKERLAGAVETEISRIEDSKSALVKQITTINTLIFFIIGVVAFIAVFVIFYTTKSITNPIQELYAGAGIIGSGNLDHRLDIKTGDEIQDLAEGFNRMAGELKEFYTDLENKVKERTIQLAEANDALALKNKELDDFTYIVSHDLKEPLRGVKAFTKLLVEDYSKKMDKEGKEYLETISESSVRMTKLIEDLLNLSRVGRIRNIEPDVDINDVLCDVKKNLGYSLEEKNVDLKFNAGGFPKMTCDRIRISEVFSNLISNAVKYSKKDVRPVVEIGYTDRPRFHEFYVKDNGIGIEKEYHDKVFQIFQRLHAKGEYEGTGAGLTIVKKIVENHSGKIWVESEAGKGSIFYFTLAKGISGK